MSQILMLLLLPWIVKGSTVPKDLKRQKFIFSFPFFTNCDLKVFVSGKPGTQVTAESNGTEIQTIEIGSTKGGSIELPNTVCYSQSETVSKESVQLSASDDIFAVVSMKGFTSNAETVALLPVPVLSNKYFIVTLPSIMDSSDYKHAAVMTITTLMDNTTVIINLKLSGTCSSYSNLTDGETIIKLLNKNDVYGIFCDSDMMGTMVESSSPIAVLSGQGRAEIPINSASRDSIVHMMPPVDLYGTEFVLHNLSQASALYRAVAAYTNTSVSWGSQERSLQPGHHVDIDTAEYGETCLTSTMPILVVVFYKSGASLPWRKAGQNIGMDYGDPFMAVVQATHQFKKSYIIPYIPKTSVQKYTAYMSIVLSSAEDKTPVTELLNITLNVKYKENLVCNKFLLFTFQPNDQETVSVALPYNFGVMFFGLGYRAGLAFFGDTFDALSSWTSTSTAISTTQITSTQENLIVTISLNSITLSSSMTQFVSNPTTTLILTQTITEVSSTIAASPTTMDLPTLTYSGILTTSMMTKGQIITNPITETSNLATMLITPTTISSTAVKEFITTSTSMIPIMSTPVSNLIVSQSSSYTSTSTANIVTTMTIPTSTDATTTTTSTTVTMTTTTATTTNSMTTTPVLDKNGQPVRTVSRKCSCFCKKKDRLDVYTDEAAKEAKKKIKDTLLVKTSTLAKAVAKKTSAADKRSSSNTIGWLGIVFMLLPVLFIVGVDLLNICSHRKVDRKIQNKNEDQYQETNDVELDPGTSLNHGVNQNNDTRSAVDVKDDIDLDSDVDDNDEDE